MIDPGLLAETVTRETGLPFVGRRRSPGEIILEPEGHPPSKTFQLLVKTEWRAISVSMEQGSFSGDLVTAMGKADAAGRAVFRSVLGACASDAASVSLSVNGSARDPADDKVWTFDWKTLSLSLRRGQLPLGDLSSATERDLVAQWVCRAAAAVIALLPLEASGPGELTSEPGLPEGALVRVEVNRYERDRRNRAAAIAIHGFACKACGLKMGTLYGQAATDLIEVHHVTPVSKMGAGYLVDPRIDLVPLCPNCHAVAHRRSPPFSVEEIRSMLQASQCPAPSS